MFQVLISVPPMPRAWAPQGRILACWLFKSEPGFSIEYLANRPGKTYRQRKRLEMRKYVREGEELRASILSVNFVLPQSGNCDKLMEQ